MSDKKISQLTAATTPLAGTEVLPIVQGGATVKVPVSDLTAGRAVSMSGLTVTSASDLGVNFNTTGTNNAASLIITNGNGTTAAGYSYARFVNSKTSPQDWRIGTYGSAALSIVNATAGTIPVNVDTSGNMSMASGSIYMSNGKGIDFSATPQPAGMTSELLADYEEGTWTPNQGSGLTLVGAFTSAGQYTKVGRLVWVRGYVNGATSVAVAAAGQVCTNLPFTVNQDSCGSAVNGSVNLTTNVYVYTTTVLNATAVPAVNGYYFSVTYMV